MNKPNNIVYVDFGNERQERLNKSAEELQNIIDSVNLSPKDKEKLENVIIKLRSGIEVALNEIHINIFSK